MSKKQGLQLFISRLSSYTTEQALKRMFSKYGLISQVRLVRDPETQRPKGFGFVTFDSEADAIKAINAMNARIVDGRLIFVEVAKTKAPEEDAAS